MLPLSSQKHVSQPTNDFFSRITSRIPVIPWNRVSHAFSSFSSYCFSSKTKLSPMVTVVQKFASETHSERKKYSLITKLFLAFAGSTIVGAGVGRVRSIFEPQTGIVGTQPQANRSNNFMNAGLNFYPNINNGLNDFTLYEEVEFSEEFFTWEIFKNLDKGHLLIVAEQENGAALPEGIKLSNERMRVLGSLDMGSNPIGTSHYPVECMAIKDQYLYFASTQGLYTFDISDPVYPIVINFFSLPILSQLAYDGNLIFLYGQDGQFYTVGLTNPNDPEIIGSKMLGAVSRMVAHNNFVYFDNDVFFNVVKVNGSNVEIIGSTYTQKSLAMDCEGDFCFLSTSQGTFFNVFVGNSTKPALMSFTQVSGQGGLACTRELCYFAGAALQVINVTNPLDLKVNSNTPLPPQVYFEGNPKISGNTLYIGSVSGNTPWFSTQINLFDVINTTNPKFGVSLDLVTPQYDVLYHFVNFINSNQYVYYVVLSSISPTEFLTLKTTKKGDTFKLSGIPGVGTQGKYKIILKAQDLNGNIVNVTSLNIEIRPAISVEKQLANQTAVVNSNFNYYLDPSTFKHVLGSSLTFSIQSINSFAVNWLHFNSLSGAFSGIPSKKDWGVVQLNITAKDSLGAQATTPLQISVIFGPVINKQIPTQIAFIDSFFSFTLDPATFKIDGNETLILSAFLADSHLLPSWLSFNQATGTFTGTPSVLDSGPLTVYVNAESSKGISVTAPVVIQVIATSAPIINRKINDQVAFVGETFKYVVPDDVFLNQLNTPLKLSATAKGQSTLYNWLTFSNNTFIGHPTPAEAGFFANKEYIISLTASNDKASNTLDMKVILTGASYWQLVAQVGGSIVSAAGFTWGLYKKRAYFWNNCRQGQYQKPTEFALVNKEYEHSIPIPAEEIETINIFINDKLLIAFPKWLSYDENKNRLFSEKIPPNENVKQYKIQVIDRTERIRDEFELHLVKDADGIDKDDEAKYDDNKDIQLKEPLIRSNTIQ